MNLGLQSKQRMFRLIEQYVKSKDIDINIEAHHEADELEKEGERYAQKYSEVLRNAP